MYICRDNYYECNNSVRLKYVFHCVDNYRKLHIFAIAKIIQCHKNKGYRTIMSVLTIITWCEKLPFKLKLRTYNHAYKK